MIRIDIVETLEIKYRLCCSSMKSDSHISRDEKHELPKIPRELIERLTNVTDLYLHFRSEIRKAYLDLFLSALQLRLVSKPIVNSKTYRQFSFVFNSRSVRKVSPVIMDGEEKPGTSAKIDDPSIAFKEVAKKLSTELCRQV